MTLHKIVHVYSQAIDLFSLKRFRFVKYIDATLIPKGIVLMSTMIY